MITGSKEYEAFLAAAARSYNFATKNIRMPTEEKVYEVDLNTRTIEAPPFIGVEADHEAELIYFKMDRFFDQFDLSKCVGMVQFRNAKNEEYYYIIPYFDIASENGKIIFAWDIQSPATKYGGVVNFSFKFFKIDPLTDELIYELNTLVAKTKVLVGWAYINGANHTYHQMNVQSLLVNEDFVRKINYLAELEDISSLYWFDA